MKRARHKRPFTGLFTGMIPFVSNFYKSQNYRDKIQTSGCLELRAGIGVACKRARGRFLEGKNVLKLDCDNCCMTILLLFSHEVMSDSWQLHGL